MANIPSESILQWANTHTPAWSHNKIIPWDEHAHDRLIPFISAEHWNANDSINVFAVVGTRNSIFYNWTWFELLGKGKRMESVNLPLYASNPAYYELPDVKLPAMDFVTFDGANFYVDTDGNHRTCIARFAFERHALNRLDGVGIKRLEVNHEMQALYQEMAALIRNKRIDASIEARRTVLGREDSSNWKVDRFRSEIVVDQADITQVLQTPAQAKQWISAHSKSWWQRLITRSSSQ
jgi:hypothetical protein